MFRLNLGLRLIFASLLLLLPSQSLDQWFYDLFFRMRVHTAGLSDIVCVRVDDSHLFEKLSSFEPRFSPSSIPFDPKGYSIWHDEFYHALINRIKSFNPKAIVFSTYYDWVHIKHKGHKLSEGIILSSTLNAENKLVPPPRALTEQYNYGFNNLFPDNDNVVRKSHLVYSSGLSLALKVYQHINHGAVTRNLLDPLWIDYRGERGHYRSFDGLAIVDGRISSLPIDGKIVIVGREESEATSLATPVGRMPRMEVLANTIDTFLQNREIHFLSKWTCTSVSAACIVLSVWAILTLPLNLSWLCLVLLAGFIFLGGLVTFAEFKLWIGVASPLLCIFGTHLILIGYRLGQQEEEQWKLTQESEYLKEMDQFKDNFISLFSHDLKTPIAKIKAITDRLLGEYPELPGSIKESLKTLDRTNAELARFISDILKVTKMEAMSLHASKDVVDLNRLVEEAVTRLKFLADEKRIEIVSDLEPLFSMEGDQKLLLEVIINLLENAIKYSLPEKKIIVRTREEVGVVRVSVIDEGPGIEVSEIPRITGKFYRGKNVAQTTKGSGLGLYLAKYFVELHSGQLNITSVLGQGTTASFTLALPS